ncbi:hypothetical protein AQZ52_02180 [Novosphingobium fuchskuhlense]|uniref:DUF2029 domain-containing protein n=1 Tax=Novosphingobium fuchskuhlense TaxID=1117702 RepID=A0A117UWH4_9SPHN|nr:hypothetical protein [Novosphingobium fuchskuhlense]KUR72135.1 hypothetical protein AQZ52_02180 [Novosphingobium fuchskuhlense]
MWRALLLAVLACLAVPLAAKAPGKPIQLDQELYRTVVERVRSGENFYPATMDAQRERSYPVQPALAVRPPTMTYLLALLPSTATRTAALIALLFGALIAMRQSLSDRPPAEALAMVALAVAGLFGAFFPDNVYLHEQWSVLLVMLALAAHRRPWLSVGLALLAVLMRETALAWLAAMVLYGLWQRDWKRTGLAVAAITLAGGLWVLHAQFVFAQVQQDDLISPGWVRFGGLSLVIDALRRNLVLTGLPGPLILVAVTASLAAMLRWGREFERIAAIGSTGFLAALTVFGRPDNGYWGFMAAPFVLLGLPLLLREGRERLRR